MQILFSLITDVVERLYSKVGPIMLNSSPVMLFQYTHNSTNYAANYAPNLPIMLKLCPLFLEGANLYVQIIITTLLHTYNVTISSPI